MKNRLLRMMILPLLIALLSGCGNPIEKDARNLAEIQKQKIEMVRKMLSCRDSLQKLELLEEINHLQKQFNQLQNTCSEKYCDSSQRAAFEWYYREHLKLTKNK
jgi:hypothetical protein